MKRRIQFVVLLLLTATAVYLAGEARDQYRLYRITRESKLRWNHFLEGREVVAISSARERLSRSPDDLAAHSDLLCFWLWRADAVSGSTASRAELFVSSATEGLRHFRRVADAARTCLLDSDCEPAFEGEIAVVALSNLLDVRQRRRLDELRHLVETTYRHNSSSKQRDRFESTYAAYDRAAREAAEILRLCPKYSTLHEQGDALADQIEALSRTVLEDVNGPRRAEGTD